MPTITLKIMVASWDTQLFVRRFFLLVRRRSPALQMAAARNAITIITMPWLGTEGVTDELLVDAAVSAM